jgi:hypothetical protein
LAVKPVRHTQLPEEVHCPLLEDARSYAVFDVLPALVLEHDAVDAAPLEQTREDEPRRPGADDTDLGPQRRHRRRYSAGRGTGR